LEIHPTVATTFCAELLIYDYGPFKTYYAKNCATGMPATINGNNLAPLPGDCAMPNGACVTVGSSVIPTAFEANGSERSGSFTVKGTKLEKKLKAGVEPINQPNPQATKPGELKERRAIGQPIFARFRPVAGSSESVLVELKRYFVKGIGQGGRERSVTIAVGVEIDQAPAEKAVRELGREQILVTDDHAARIEIGNVTYNIVTASKLTP
jgi:hypothetical protein